MDNENCSMDNIVKIEDNEMEQDFVEIEIPFDLYQHLSSNNCNIQNICRICLSPNNDELFPIIRTKEENNMLAEMFSSLTSIQVFLEDGLPTFICLSCQTQVVHCYEFKSKCERSDYTLRSVLKGEFISKVEKIEDEVPIVEDTKDKLITEIILKEEPDVNDTQDLKNLSDEILNNAQSIVQNTAKRKKKKTVDISISDANSLLKEVCSKTKKNKYLVCPFCSKKYLKAKALNAHIKDDHENTEQLYSCGQCEKAFSSEHDLFIHSALHSEGSTWKCNQCPKEFDIKTTFQRHIQRHMKSKRYTCETCDKSFTELYALRRHTRVHTGEIIEKKYACHLCDKRYSESGLLTAHVARHTGARPCTCTICGKTFPSRRLLNSHTLVHSDQKPFSCRYCDKRFRHESTRNTHHRTHTGEKPYVCSVCGKTFIQNSNLTLHMRTHTGERPYTCSQCGRKFSAGSSLKAHVRTHTGERPYSCSVCGKKFARGSMNTHMRLHTGERPYKCGACGKSFITPSKLRDHARIHTGEKPFECERCSKNFSTKADLVKHIKSHQTKKKKSLKKRMVAVQQDGKHSFVVSNQILFNKEGDKMMDAVENLVMEQVDECGNVSHNDIILEMTQEPLEVSGELILPADNNGKAELLVVDNSRTDTNYQDGICLNANDVNFVNNDIDYSNDVNLVTVNEGGVSISSSSAMLEGATVKLYQLDQSLVQIHSSGGQVTISKITSKMTANF